MDTLEQQVLLAKEDEGVLETLIEERKDWILKCASASVHHDVTDSDDEWSVTLWAFHEAVRFYRPEKGNFLSFADLVISRRLTDFLRSEGRREGELPVEPASFEGQADGETGQAVDHRGWDAAAEGSGRIDAAAGAWDEIRDGLAAALREDGRAVTTDLPFQAGETIDLPAGAVPDEEGARPGPGPGRWIGGLAAAAVALAVIGGAYSYNTAFASSYLSVDAQGASVELALNRRGQVIDVRGVNGDSVILAQELSATLDRMPVEEALEQTMDTMTRRGYLKDPGEPVVIGVTADSEKREAVLDAAVDRITRESGRREVVALDVTPGQREEAARLQQSGGAYVYEKRQPAQAPKENADPTPVQPQTQPETAPADQPGDEPRSPVPAATVQPSEKPRSSQGQTARPAENQSVPQPEEAPRDTGAEPAPSPPRDSPGEPQETGQPQIPDSEQPPAPQDAGGGEDGPAEQAPGAEDQLPAAQEPMEAPPETEPEAQAPHPTEQAGGSEQTEPAVSPPEQPPAAQPEAPNDGGVPAATQENVREASPPPQQEHGAEGPQGQGPAPDQPEP